MPAPCGYNRDVFARAGRFPPFAGFSLPPGDAASPHSALIMSSLLLMLESLFSRERQPSAWRFSSTESRVALAVLFLALVARWQALSLGYSSDDVRLIHFAAPDPELRGLLLSQGRLLSLWLMSGLSALGIFPPHAAVLGQVVMHLALTWCGLLLARLWRLDSPVEAFLLVATWTLHPYLAEIASFRVTPLYFALAIAPAVWAFVHCTRSLRLWCASLLAAVAVLMVYQVALNYLVMALLLCVVFDIAGRAPAFGNPFRLRLALLVATCAIYLPLTALFQFFSAIPAESRAQTLNFAELTARVPVLLAFWKSFLIAAEPILPVATKLLLLVTVAAGPILLLFHSPSSPASRRFLAALLLAFAIGVPACTGVIAVLRNFWPAPRVLTHSGLFWGALLVLSFRAIPARLRPLWLSASSLLLLSFIGLNNLVFNDQLRLNQRDFHLATRLLARIESLPDYPSISELALIGGSWTHPSPIQSTQNDLNVPAIFAPWSRVHLINEVSGLAFREPSREFLSLAARHCQTAPKWPLPQSVSRIERAAVVCLGP